MSEKISKIEVINYNNSEKGSVKYKINDTTTISACNTGLDYTNYIVNGGKIIDPNNKPAYGFKLVRNSYDQYMYMRLSDNAVIPYIFDFATNFNKNGLAMVAVNGTVTWINKKFKYLTRNGKIENINEVDNIQGWKFISAFTGDETKLSRCYVDCGSGDWINRYTSYLGTDFKCKEFYEYNGYKCSNGTVARFNGDFSDFDKEGFAYRANGGLILSNIGYYMTTDAFIEAIIKQNKDSIIKTAIEDGTLTTLNREIQSDKVFKKEKTN